MREANEEEDNKHTDSTRAGPRLGLGKNGSSLHTAYTQSLPSAKPRLCVPNGTLALGLAGLGLRGGVVLSPLCFFFQMQRDGEGQEQGQEQTAAPIWSRLQQSSRGSECMQVYTQTHTQKAQIR